MSADGISFADLLAMQASDFAERCTSCGFCLDLCPVFPMTETASKVGSERTIDAIIELLKTGQVADEAYEMVLSCSQGCGHRCMAPCEEQLMPNVTFIHALSKIRALGKPLPDCVDEYNPRKRLNFKNVFAALQEGPSGDRWVTEIPPNPEPVDVVFFGGCTAHGMPHLLSEAVGILDAMGINFVALDGKDRCCGSGDVVSGNSAEAQTTGAALISDLARFRPKEVVLYCLGCQLIVSGPIAMSMEVPFKTMGLIDFLSNHMDKIPFKPVPQRRIALHDSCILASFPDYAEKARALLKAIPGITLTELKHNRNDAQCCGAVTATKFPAVGEKMRVNALKEGEGAGVDVLTTFCGGCHQSFAPLEDRFRFEIANYVSLVAESVGVRHKDVYKKYAGCGDIKQVVCNAGSCIAASQLTADEIEGVLPAYVEPFRHK